MILIDQLKEIYVDGDARHGRNRQLVPQDLSARTIRSALNNTGSGVDDPDQQFYENYACGSLRNYGGYCNHELDKKFDEQSIDDRPGERARSWSGRSTGSCRRTARGRSSFTRVNATCMQPYVKGLTIMVNSIYNGWRMEDVWLDR